MNWARSGGVEGAYPRVTAFHTSRRSAFKNPDDVRGAQKPTGRTDLICAGNKKTKKKPTAGDAAVKGRHR